MASMVLCIELLFSSIKDASIIWCPMEHATFFFSFYRIPQELSLYTLLRSRIVCLLYSFLGNIPKDTTRESNANEKSGTVSLVPSSEICYYFFGKEKPKTEGKTAISDASKN